jgi:hypothetical protein
MLQNIHKKGREGFVISKDLCSLKPEIILGVIVANILYNSL